MVFVKPAPFFMNCLHLALHLILRYEDLQDVLVHSHAEASVLTLHRETLSASSCSASTVQPLPQPVLLSPGRLHSQRIHHCKPVCGADSEETQRQPCGNIKYSHLHINIFHSTYIRRNILLSFLILHSKRDTEDQAYNSPRRKGNETITRVDYKIKLKCSGHSHSTGNKRHTGVLTCPAPSQLDHKAVGYVSLSVWGHLGVAALTGPHKKVRYGGQVRAECTGQGQVRLRWVGRGYAVGGLQREKTDTQT